MTWVGNGGGFSVDILEGLGWKIFFFLFFALGFFDIGGFYLI